MLWQVKVMSPFCSAVLNKELSDLTTFILLSITKQYFKPINTRRMATANKTYVSGKN